MDIAAAKDIIAMYIDMENELQNEGYNERIKKAEKLNNELPATHNKDGLYACGHYFPDTLS